MISCACPACRAPLQIPETFAGKRVKCPKCKNPLSVPGGTAAAPPVVKATRPTPKPPVDVDDVETSFEPVKRPAVTARSRRPVEDDDVDERPRKKKRAAAKPSTFPWVWVLGGGGAGLLAVIAVIVLVVMLGSGSSNKKNAVAAADPKAVKGVDKGAKSPAGIVVPVFEAPKDPLPALIAVEATQRVKKSTAQIRVTSANNDKGEGSGFFAIERGLVVTNAHVVGMLHSLEKPQSVEVVINSGEPDEYVRDALVLGVDQDEDLALLRLGGDKESLPPPMNVDSLSPLTELQKVYIFGFPFGAQLGKNITVAESSISSIRKNKDGALHQIQVNGGMHPGNSGGPVVDSRGNVVGVSVAVIKGTLINFAIPAEKVYGLIQGRVLSTQFGEPYRDLDSIRMPLKIACLDPMSRVKAVKLDVWTGPAAASRPASSVPPIAVVGDGTKKSVSLNYTLNEGTANVLVPTIPGGHALWVQPILQHASGRLAWSHAFTVPAATSSPLERVPAKLSLRFGESSERTLDVASKLNLQLFAGNKKLDIYQKLETDLLEVVQPQGNKIGVRLSVGNVKVENAVEDRTTPYNPRAIDLFRRFTYSFNLAPQGHLLEVGSPAWNRNIDLDTRLDADDLVSLLLNAYEAGSFSLPDRQVKPLETWGTNVTVLFGSGQVKQPADVLLNCTYEGLRASGGKKEAFIRLDGDARPRFKNRDSLKGRVTGHALVDLERGYLSKIAVSIRSDVEKGDLFAITTFEATLARTAGNPRSIRPAPAQPVGPVVKNPKNVPAGGKVVLEKADTLNVNDPSYGPRKTQHHAVPIPLTAGKTYVIDHLQTQQGQFDPFLVLENPGGAVIEVDDDGGGGLNSRIVVQPDQTGQYRIIATALVPINAPAPYLLRVREIGN